MLASHRPWRRPIADAFLIRRKGDANHAIDRRARRIQREWAAFERLCCGRWAALPLDA
jgi:hypothetical protein